MKPRMQRPFTATPGCQRGAVMVLIVIALASILLMGALALDGGHMLLNKARLQNAVDAAALSGAKTLFQVKDSGNAYSRTRDAAWNTLLLNAKAEGNAELLDAIDKVGGVENFAVVGVSSRVYGTFSAAPTSDARFVRVWVRNYGLTGFFWGVLNMFGSGDLEKAVAAIATAGWSPTATTCDIDPIVVCSKSGENDAGDPEDPYDGVFWGYEFGELVTLTCGTPGTPSAGNCQLLRLGDSKGGADIRQAFCAGTGQCLDDTRSVDTEPGITWGPVAQGLNTRLGIYNGPVDSSCPQDWYTGFSEPLVTMDGETPTYQSEEVISNGGDLSTGAADVIDVKNWQGATAACASNPGSCDGVGGRRILNVVIGDCAGVPGGATSVPVLGVGCFYLLQRVQQSGDKQVLGQFMTECEGSGYTGATSADDVGPNIIQLYKTYLDYEDCGPDDEVCPPPSPDS